MNNDMKILKKKSMTKKALKKAYAKNRIENGFNTGIRNMKSNKDYNRNEGKKTIRNFEDIY